jgi:hypothetical protein
LSILNGSEGSGATRIVGTVAMTLSVQALTAMALAVPAVLAPVAALAVRGRNSTDHS